MVHEGSVVEVVVVEVVVVLVVVVVVVGHPDGQPEDDWQASRHSRRSHWATHDLQLAPSQHCPMSHVPMPLLHAVPSV